MSEGVGVCVSVCTLCVYSVCMCTQCVCVCVLCLCLFSESVLIVCVCMCTLCVYSVCMFVRCVCQCVIVDHFVQCVQICALPLDINPGNIILLAL